MKTVRRYLPFFILLSSLLTAFAISAQEGGQLWVRAFEDRDGDGVRDANEPLLTEGVSVELVHEGIVIETAVLDDAPYASQGLVGFQFLEPGEYTVNIAAGEFTPTTPVSVTVQVGGSGLPPVIEFGGQPLSAVPAVGEGTPLLEFEPRDPETMRLAVAALGGVIVAGVVAGFGFLIYLLTLRPRYRAAIKAAQKRSTMTTGSMRAVVVEDKPKTEEIYTVDEDQTI